MARIATVAVIGGAALLYYLGKKAMSAPRGIRNNNPGNIELGTNWNGMADIQRDSRYITFATPEYGIRAMTRILRTYRERHGIYTIEGIINRWAPPIENPTEGYIAFIENRTGIPARKHLSFTDDNVADLIAAIIQFENGQQPYSRMTLLSGIEMERK